jgi:hypothetical protein
MHKRWQNLRMSAPVPARMKKTPFPMGAVNAIVHHASW